MVRAALVFQRPTSKLIHHPQDSWLRLLQAAASGDRDACVRWSTQVGYLTGAEDEVMVDAHVKSMTLLATPFR